MKTAVFFTLSLVFLAYAALGGVTVAEMTPDNIAFGLQLYQSAGQVAQSPVEFVIEASDDQGQISGFCAPEGHPFRFFIALPTAARPQARVNLSADLPPDEGRSVYEALHREIQTQWGLCEESWSSCNCYPTPAGDELEDIFSGRTADYHVCAWQGDQRRAYLDVCWSPVSRLIMIRAQFEGTRPK